MWIRLKNIQLYAYHGAHEYEKEHGGRFDIDVEVRAELPNAVKSDALGDTINYVALQETVVDRVTMQRFNLIESLANSIATSILEQFPVEEVIIRIRKPGAATGGVLDTVEVECQKLRER